MPPGDERTGWLLRYEAWLRLLARTENDSRFQGKFDASDAVQQTLLEAWKCWDNFRARQEPQRLAWLGKSWRISSLPWHAITLVRNSGT